MGLDRAMRPLNSSYCVLLGLLVGFPPLRSAAAQELNVYGQPLQRCGGTASGNAGSSEAGRCSFRQYDAGAHQVCVDQLPHGFSSKTGQGPWSNSHSGEPWCICIWAFSHWTNHLPESEAVPLRCDAVSSKVVDSAFATRHLRTCRAQPCDEDKSIRRLCQTCAKQAGVENAGGRAYLTEKCRAMGVLEEELRAALPAPDPLPTAAHVGVVNSSDDEAVSVGGAGLKLEGCKAGQTDCNPEKEMPAVNMMKKVEL